MADINKVINDLKNGLKEFITKDMSKEQVDKISGLGTLIDQVETEYNAVNQGYAELKDDYIKVIKHTSFKSKTDPREEAASGAKELTFEQCLSEVLQAEKGDK